MKLYRITDIAKKTAWSTYTVRRWARVLFPQRFVNGIATKFTESEYLEILNVIEKYQQMPTGLDKLLLAYLQSEKERIEREANKEGNL